MNYELLKGFMVKGPQHSWKFGINIYIEVGRSVPLPKRTILQDETYNI